MNRVLQEESKQLNEQIIILKRVYILFLFFYLFLFLFYFILFYFIFLIFRLH